MFCNVLKRLVHDLNGFATYLESPVLANLLNISIDRFTVFQLSPCVVLCFSFYIRYGCAFFQFQVATLSALQFLHFRYTFRTTSVYIGFSLQMFPHTNHGFCIVAACIVVVYLSWFGVSRWLYICFHFQCSYFLICIPPDSGACLNMFLVFHVLVFYE